MIEFTHTRFSNTDNIQEIAETIAEQIGGYCTQVDGYVNPEGYGSPNQYLIHFCENDYLYKNGLYIGGNQTLSGCLFQWVFNGFPGGFNRNEYPLRYPTHLSANTYCDVNTYTNGTSCAIEIKFPYKYYNSSSSSLVEQEDHRGPHMFIDTGHSIYDENETYGIYVCDMQSWRNTYGYSTGSNDAADIRGVAKNSFNNISSEFQYYKPSSYMTMTNFNIPNEHIISPNIYIRENDYYDRAGILPVISGQEALKIKNEELTNWHTFSIKDVGHFICTAAPDEIIIQHDSYEHCPALVLKIQ